MEQSLFTEKQLARCYAHYVYRNTVIEDFHAEGVCMDDAIYRKMYRVVRAKTENIKKYSQYLSLLEYGENIAQGLDTLPPDIAVPVIRFIKDIIFNSYMGSGWEEAQLLDKLPEKSMPHYILAGTFREYCDDHAKLTDSAMREINKDIHNRIYTLIVHKML